MAQILRLLLLVAILILFGGGIFLWQQSMRETEPREDASATSNTGKAANEAKYLANLQAQIEEARPLAARAVTVAKHAELRAIAQQYLDDSSDERVQVAEWQRQWGYENTAPDKLRLPRSYSLESHQRMVAQLQSVEADEFDKLFLEYLRILTSADVQLGFKIDGKSIHQELENFTAKVRTSRYDIANAIAEWPEEWGYVPRHDG